jgi:septum formation protein
VNQPFVYLASASPRRRELLAQIGVRHAVHPVSVDETPLADEGAGDYVQRLAAAKALEGLASLDVRPSPVVLGADTAVVLDGEIMGKPADVAEATAMLERLEARRHQVYSAVAGAAGGPVRMALSVSAVTFRKIEPAEIRAYVASGEPLDKAGAYGIQGLGAVFVSRLEGSYSGVMGLPLFETAALLGEFGIHSLGAAAA